jgi:signal transduction histidine kinase
LLKSQFVANVSHEFKNPLAILLASIESLSDGIAGDINPKQKSILERTTRTLNRLLRLINDLLDISRIEAGNMEVSKEDVDVRSLVAEIAEFHEEELLRKQLIFTADIQKDIGPVFADKDKLTEILFNLFNNAIKYSRDGGNIAIRITDTGEELRFEISDAGLGIPEDCFDKIFDKFERITSEKQEGTGLGLPIAKELVKLHNGRIWVESEIGKGSTFIFVLPKRAHETA